ncbi:DoxX family protein [Saccharopolyspora hirsuta]|uniref:DoxX family protein n=1 Tax=Saccharopolyspora hirsuta TaxID=1837 RepID=A0A5M7BDU3_SACHI|nr:DoxX family protein [Saccharopolyspora hirsuta]KAA5825355.1 DoxX family protein [Saccharopolyspora hirsuta]MBF6512468.1 DoxX family protein [Nocardia farcinica]
MQHRLRDVMALVARIVVGATFLAHGYQKFVLNGMDKVVASFDQLGLPPIAAWFTAIVEVVGGIGLILGVLLPIVGILLAAIMVGALFTAHLSGGFFSSDGGFEYVLVLAATSLALGFSGPRYTLSGLFRGSSEKSGQLAA